MLVILLKDVMNALIQTNVFLATQVMFFLHILIMSTNTVSQQPLLHLILLLIGLNVIQLVKVLLKELRPTHRLELTLNGLAITLMLQVALDR